MINRLEVTKGLNRKKSMLVFYLVRDSNEIMRAAFRGSVVPIGRGHWQTGHLGGS